MLILVVLILPMTETFIKMFQNEQSLMMVKHISIQLLAARSPLGLLLNMLCLYHGSLLFFTAQSFQYKLANASIVSQS